MSGIMGSVLYDSQDLFNNHRFKNAHDLNCLCVHSFQMTFSKILTIIRRNVRLLSNMERRGDDGIQTDAKNCPVREKLKRNSASKGMARLLQPSQG